MKTSDRTRTKITSILGIFLILSLLLASHAAPVSAAGAVTYTIKDEFPASFSLFVPCAAGGAGETFDVTGVIKETVHVTQTGSGNFVFTAHDILNDWVAVGQTTQEVYRAVGASQATFMFGKASSFSFVDNYMYVGPGKGNNYFLMSVYHDVSIPDGLPEITIDRVTVECR